jgi:AraC-like DNA-binding protein
MDLIWGSDGQLFVAGPDTRAHMFTAETTATLVGLRFAPGMGPSVLGVPAHELRDQRVPLEAIWRPADARRLAERIGDSPHPGRSLEALAEDRLSVSDTSTDPVAEIVRLLRSGRSVSDVGRAVGLSERQLHRRSLDAFGYGPKTLARILRLGRAVDLARAGVAFVEVADRSGYADQAHLARDAKALAGVSLTALSR